MNVENHCQILEGALLINSPAGGAGKARFNVATPTYEARTRPLHDLASREQDVF